MPLDPALLLAFLGAIVLISVLPGPDMLYVVANGLRHGPRGGLVAAVGVQGGMLVHTVAAAAGLSAVIASSATAFEAIRAAGIVYLLFLAVAALRSEAAPVADPARAQRSASPLRIARQAAVTNLLNPKVIVFFLAFLPQFVDPSRGHVTLQLLLLGVIFMVVGLAVDALVGLLAGSLGARLARSRRVARLLNRAAAVVYVGLAARLATDR